MNHTNLDNPTPDARDDLLRRMHEAAALAPHDPARLDVLRDVVAAGDWAEREWVDLVADDERLRLDLWRVTPPGSLNARLLALPHSSAADPPPRHRVLPRSAAAVAAALLVGLGVYLALGPLSASAVAERFHGFAAACVEHLLSHLPIVVQTDDIHELNTKLARTVHFPATVPDLGPRGFTLVGARPCHLHSHDIIQSRWTRDGRNYSLYVFCPPDHALPSEFDDFAVRLTRPASDGKTRRVELWSDGHCGYALVPEDGVDDPAPDAPPSGRHDPGK